MGLLTEVALYFLGLITIYVGLHDFLGLNVIPYSFFDNFLAPAFVAFLFIVLISLLYWLHCVNRMPLKKKPLKLLKSSILVLATGIFFTALPLEESSTAKLIIGKILIIVGLALAFLAFKVNDKLSCFGQAEQRSGNKRQYS